MTQIDVNAWIGTYPFHGGREWTPADLLEQMLRVGTDEAWVSHFGSAVAADPERSNHELYAATRTDPRLRPVPSVHPDLVDVGATLSAATANGAPAVRWDPWLSGLAPALERAHDLLAGCAARRLPLITAVRLEDIRQREAHDPAVDLQPWAVRQLVRSHPAAQLIVTNADREFIEQVHFGSTPDEAGRVLWDICWIWGPPEDQLELLLGTVGIARFTFGTMLPLRLPEAVVARLDLLDIDAATRARLTAGNVRTFVA